MLGGIFGAVRRDASRYIVQGISIKQSRHRREVCKASVRSEVRRRSEVCKASERGLEVISSPPKLGGEPIGGVVCARLCRLALPRT